MTWAASLTHVAAVTLRRIAALAHPTASLTEAGSGPATSTSPTPNSGIAQPTTPDLTGRAHRQCNRSQALIDAYLAMHKTLGRGL